MNRIIPYLLAAATAIPAVPVTAAVTTCASDSDKRAIAEAYTARWVSVLNAAEPRDISALYAESAILMPPSDETIVGRGPIAAYLRAHPGPAAQAEYRVDIVSCELRGNALHIAGVWGAEAQRGGAAGTLATGNVLRVLEADAAGAWRSRYEIWN